MLCYNLSWCFVQGAAFLIGALPRKYQDAIQVSTMLCYNCCCDQEIIMQTGGTPMLKIVFIMLDYAFLSVLLSILELFGI
jgi:hypothetical protein